MIFGIDAGEIKRYDSPVVVCAVSSREVLP